jgi:hypothetical protein
VSWTATSESQQAVEPWWRRVLSTTDWRNETIQAALTGVFSVLVGGVVGEIWRAVASRVDVRMAAAGSDAATKALLDDDVQFAALGALAGLLLAVTVAVLLRRGGVGPGAVLGLAAGGVVGGLVAAHVGELARQHEFAIATLHHRFPHAKRAALAAFRTTVKFQLRTHAALLAWPIVATVVVAARPAWQETTRERPAEPAPMATRF